MNNIKEFLIKFLYIISARKSNLFLLLLLFIFSSTLDALGIGLVGPFMNLATNPDIIIKNYWLSTINDRFEFKSASQLISLLGVFLVGIFYIKSFVYFQAQKYILNFSISELGNLRLRLLRGYLFVNYSYHLNKNSASLIHLLTKETFNFCYFITIPLLNLIANIFVVSFLLSILFRTNYSATISILVMLLLAFIFYNRFKDQMAYWGKEGSESDTEMIRIINHSIGGIKETRVIGCESYFDKQMNVQIQRHASAATLAQIWQNVPRILLEALLVSALVGLVSISLLLNQNSQNLISMLSIFAVASIRLMPAASQLMSSIGTLRNHSHSLNRLYYELREIEDINLNIKNSLNYTLDSKIEQLVNNKNSYKLQKLPFKQRILITGIDYSYANTEEKALQQISLTISKGQSIAFIGKSGSGKTTLVDLILGLLMPNNGDIQVDDISIYENLRAWQNLIGYIPQSIFLTDDTIERNIAFGVTDELIDQQQLKEAIEAAQLEELITELPNGIQTTVGERGVRLSGGQRQRIGIARAIYHEREILVLDEATSALDNETETLVTQAIRNLSKTKTVIIIAHRLSTVEHCDCIYMLDKGRVINYGNYEQVIQKTGFSSNKTTNK
jgi:ATP-binding cassette, subfamily B, bacterial PglK